MTGLADFAAKHGLTPRQLADAAAVTESHARYILAGDRQPSKERIDALLAFCRTIDPDITYDALFGGGSEEEIRAAVDEASSRAGASCGSEGQP